MTLCEAQKVIAEFNEGGWRDREEKLFITRLREAGLNDMQIASVLITIKTICDHCLDEDADKCYCHPYYDI
jgi:hypothetical protein